jgi:hypothetical protein
MIEMEVLLLYLEVMDLDQKLGFELKPSDSDGFLVSATTMYGRPLKAFCASWSSVRVSVTYE